MPTTVELTLACGDYEITRPLKEGEVRPDGVDLKVVTAMDSPTRHWRFLRNREFDMAEVSSSSYVAASDNGLPFRAIPVFPHRRFRHGFAFVNTGKGISKPTDLIGRKVGVKFRRVPKGKTIVDMLVAGELDAVLHPDLIKPLRDRGPRVGRLFPNYKADEAAYFAKTGIFPIMHVLGFRQEVVERYPWVPVNVFQAFNEAKAIAMKRMENPRIVPLAWYREAWEEQQEIFGVDPWEYGLSERNRKNVETLVGYSHEQGLIKRRIPLDELFLNVSQ